MLRIMYMYFPSFSLFLSLFLKKKNEITKKCFEDNKNEKKKMRKKQIKMKSSTTCVDIVSNDLSTCINI